MYLLIDWGNTQLKYLLVKELSDLRDGVEVQVTDSIAQCLDGCEKVLAGQDIENVLIASVKSDQDNQHLEGELTIRGWCYSFANTSAKACGVQCGYQDPSRLGVDRWLTIIAAHENDKNIGVIDIGTAIKLDIVNGHGKHLGGHILPGRKLMRNSLLKTARVRAEQEVAAREKFTLGSSTEECVEFGIEQLINAYLIRSVNQASKEYQVKTWLLTGGGGGYWCELLTRQIDNNKSIFISKPLLVFDGLVELYSKKGHYSKNEHL